MKVTPRSTIKKFDIGKLRTSKAKQDFKLKLRNRFHVLQDHDSENDTQINELWETIRETYSESSEKVLGYKRQVYKDWITPGTWKLIDERKDLKTKLNNTHSEKLKHIIREEYTNKNKEVKKATKKDSQTFIEDRAEEAEKAAAEQRMGDLYQITRKLCGKRRNTNMPVRDKHGKLITFE